VIDDVPVADPFRVVFWDIIMIAAGFAGASTFAADLGARWALFAFGMAAFGVVLHALAVPFLATATAKGPKTASLYKQLTLLTVVMWSAYPVVWAVGEGAGIASADQETIAYAFMDIVAKCVFGFICITGNASIEHETSTHSPVDSKSPLLESTGTSATASSPRNDS